MSSIAIQIGNSDDKLTQEQWACFVLEVRALIDRDGGPIHFWGASVNYEPWQNLCCVFGATGSTAALLCELTDIRKKYRQDSVAVLIGETQFI